MSSKTPKTQEAGLGRPSDSGILPKPLFLIQVFFNPHPEKRRIAQSLAFSNLFHRFDIVRIKPHCNSPLSSSNEFYPGLLCISVIVLKTMAFPESCSFFIGLKFWFFFHNYLPLVLK